MTKILEATTANGAAVDIAVVDQNLTIQEIYDQLIVPSLGREIFKVYNQTGPLAGIFTLDQVGSKVKLLRSDSQVFDSSPINTGISKEAAQDIESQFGMDANKIIASLLRGLANDQENIKTIEFLASKATTQTPIVLSAPNNSKFIVEEITQAVAESIMEMNKNGFITYKSSVVIPAKFAGSFAIRGEDVTEGSDSSFHMARIGHTKYYVNPDTTNTDTIYVLLNDEDRSSGFFSKYTDDIVTAVDPDTGAENFFIFNRFAITESPKHAINSMIHSIKVS